MRADGIRALLLSAVCALSLGASLEPEGASAARPKRLGAVVGPVRLLPAGDDLLSVEGAGRYFDELQVASATNGLVLSNRLPLERYLLGLNEVPTSWPFEALKAQAVAARTYALHTLDQGPGGDAAVYGFDICASVQCQVFSGAEVVDSVTGGRWIAAVEATAGRAVLYDGAPILARYHSTSGGRTFDNPEIFTEEPAYPYLVGVDSPTEEGSPLFRWTTRFRLGALRSMLVEAGLVERAIGRFDSVRTVESSAGFHYPDVTVRATQGTVRFTAEDLRVALRELAPQRFPDLYPSVARTASGRLPETFPSNRISAFTRKGTVIVVGRGWGHGVGMSQWGAHGLALSGATSDEILTHYYTGVTIGEAPDPGPIEVGLQWGLGRVTVSGSFRMIDGRGDVIVKHAIGTWGFDPAGPGAVAVDPPKGFGLPLEVGVVHAPKKVRIAASTHLTVALSRPAEVTTVTLAAPTGYEDPGTKVKSAGRARVPWLAPLEPGLYEVRVSASSGASVRKSEPVRIRVLDVPPPDEPGGPETASEAPGGPVAEAWVLAGTAAFALAVVAVALLRRRRKNAAAAGPPSKLTL